MKKKVLTPLSKVKALAEAKGIVFSTAEFEWLADIDPSELPEATPGSKEGNFYYDMVSWRIMLKKGADQDNLAGLVETCYCEIKDKKFFFLVVS